MRKILFCLVCCTAILASCTSKNKNQENHNTLRVSIPNDPATMDPRKGADVVSSALHFLLFDGLTRLNSDGSVGLAQAHSIEISENKTTYTFSLRKTTWSDGTPVTAYDFEKSWKDILDPNFPAANAQLFYPIKNAEEAKKGLVPLKDVGIKALDNQTLVVQLVRPTPYFLELISFCVFFPVNHTVDEQHPDWAFHAGSTFTSNGCFTLKKWKHHGEILLEKNPSYWDEKNIHLSQVHFSLVDNEATVLQMYERGELDVVGHILSPLPIDALPKFLKAGLLQIHPIAGSTICAFNTRAFPFYNVHMRKAFSYAMDRESIVKNITQLNEIPALGAIPPVLKNNRRRDFFPDHDLEQARYHFNKGLEELGIEAKDLNLTYIYTTSEMEHKVAQALQQQWNKAFNIHVKLENMDHKILLNRLTKRSYTFGQAVWYAQYNDQMNIFERYKSGKNVKNYANWENPHFISLLEKSFLTESFEERLKILEQAEEIFMDDLPVAPIFHRNSVTLFKPYVKNVTFTPIGCFCIERLVLDPDRSCSKVAQ